jgi:YVTN family beta-propeller protein
MILRLLLLLLLTSWAYATTLQGMVVTGISPELGNELGRGEPLGGVDIEVEGTEFHVVSSPNGYFHFEDVPDGEYRLKAHKAGFQDATLRVRVGGLIARCQILINPGRGGGGDPTSMPGDLVVAYSKKPPNVNDLESSPFKNIWQMVIAAGGKISVRPEELPHQPTGWGLSYLMNAISTDENCLMFFPFSNPSRTEFLKTPIRPYWTCYDRTGTLLFVGAEAQIIQVLDSRQKYKTIRNIPMDGAITDLRLCADGRYITVCLMGARPGVALLDPQELKVAGFLPTPYSPWSACLVGGRVFAVMGDSRFGQVVALDARSGQIVGQCKVGNCPTDVRATPDGSTLAVACSGNACVALLDSLEVKLKATVKVDVQPQKLAISPDGKRCLVPSRQNNTVTMIDLASAQTTAVTEVGQAPVGICYSRDGRHAYVACRDSGVIMVLDGKNAQVLHTTIPLPHAVPIGVCIHP